MEPETTTKRRALNGKEKTIFAAAVVNPVLTEDIFTEPEERRYSRVSGSEFIPYLDRSNGFLNKLYSIVDNSPTARALIQQKTTLSLGDGFIINSGRYNPIIASYKTGLAPVPASEAAELVEYISNINASGETLSNVLAAFFFEYFAFGNAAVELVRVEAGGARKLMVYALPFRKMRVKRPDSGEVAAVIGVSDDWKLNRPTVDEIPLFPVFSEPADGVSRSVIYLKNYSPQLDFYGLPDWIAALSWAEIEYRIPRYNIAKFKNGYVPSAIVQFFGSATEAEAKDLIDKFQDKFTDTGNNAKIFAQVLRDESLKCHVEKLTDDSDGNYMELQTLATQAIVTAFRSTMALAGIATGGKLGTNQQTKQEFEIFYNTVIIPAQKKILSRLVNPIIAEAAAWAGMSLEYSLSIANSTPISFKGDLDINSVLTVNERREILGFEPLENENTLNNADDINTSD